MKIWKRRYFVLYPGVLKTFKTDDESPSSLKVEFHLSDATRIDLNLENKVHSRNSSIFGSLVPQLRRPSSFEGAKAEPVMPLSAPPMGRVVSSDQKDNHVSNSVFVLKGFQLDGSPYEITVDAGDIVSKNGWVQAITVEINRLKKSSNVRKGLFENSYSSFTLSHNAKVSSPNLRMICAACSSLTVKMSPLFRWESQRAGNKDKLQHYIFLDNRSCWQMF